MRDALSQSAMEYLITYGWSILIVAVVLAALAYLGVFNPLYFAPKANPGSCQVFRPNGAGTSYDINLLGVCQGEIPEYVAQFNGGITFNSLSTEYPITSSDQFTLVFWIYLTGYPPNSMDNNFVQLNNEYGGISYRVAYSNSNNEVCAKNIDIWELICSNIAIPLNSWTQVAYVYNALSLQIYLNSKSEGSGTWTSINPSSGDFYSLYPDYSAGYPIPPYEGSNIQIYNTSLDSASVNALYQEGIGGAPIDLQNLAGWWPLNGNANDYSGNGNNGASTGVAYTSSWISSYAQP